MPTVQHFEPDNQIAKEFYPKLLEKLDISVALEDQLEDIEEGDDDDGLEEEVEEEESSGASDNDELDEEEIEELLNDAINAGQLKLVLPPTIDR